MTLRSKHLAALESDIANHPDVAMIFGCSAMLMLMLRLSPPSWFSVWHCHRQKVTRWVCSLSHLSISSCLSICLLLPLLLPSLHLFLSAGAAAAAAAAAVSLCLPVSLQLFHLHQVLRLIPVSLQLFHLHRIHLRGMSSCFFFITILILYSFSHLSALRCDTSKLLKSTIQN